MAVVKPFEAAFERRIPRKKGEDWLESEDLPSGWFGLSHRWCDSKKGRRRARGRWFCLQNKENGSKIYRTLKFEPSLKGTPKGNADGSPGEIWMDWDGWLALSGRAEVTPKCMSLRIRPAKWWETARLADSHPDPAYRLAVRLAWILGILSFAVGAVSLVVTFSY